jgi:hypothetical protein
MSDRLTKRMTDAEALVDALRHAQPCAGCAALRADMEAAAGELRVPLPEPGTDMARLVSANVIMRRERAALREALTALVAKWSASGEWPQRYCADELRAALAQSQPDGTPTP